MNFEGGRRFISNWLGLFGNQRFLYFIHSKDYESDPSSAHKPSATYLCLWFASAMQSFVIDHNTCRLQSIDMLLYRCAARAAAHSTDRESTKQAAGLVGFVIHYNRRSVETV